VLWLLPVVCAITGLLVLARCAAIVRRETGPTLGSLDRFGREVQAAVVRVQDRTAHARSRFDR
jgi:hypothetical protein